MSIVFILYLLFNARKVFYLLNYLFTHASLCTMAQNMISNRKQELTSLYSLFGLWIRLWQLPFAWICQIMGLLFGYCTHLDATAFSASFNHKQQKQRKLLRPNKSIMMTPTKLQCEKTWTYLFSTIHSFRIICFLKKDMIIILSNKFKKQGWLVKPAWPSATYLSNWTFLILQYFQKAYKYMFHI